MQRLLDEWISENPSEHGYFTVVQHDDGPLLNLPPNTKVYGSCFGDVPIPLIYEDTRHTFERIPRKSFQEKDIFCSFVGNITSNHVMPNVREELFKTLNYPFILIDSGGWTSVVNQSLQELFIETTLDSKFVLAPRGYGRSSFRFFECFQLGTIPVYIWNDVNWLPFQKQIDYTKLCVVLHVSEIDRLEQILLKIGEDEYNGMLCYYEEIKHLFQLEGMTKQIIKEESRTYMIITACLENKIGVKNGPEREKRYVESIRTSLALLDKNIKPIIVENNGKRHTCLDDLGCDVYYTNNNELPFDGETKGFIELMDIQEVIEHYHIQDNDMIIKMTGRYKLLDSSFIDTVNANPQYDAFFKFFNVCTLKFESEDCVLGLYAMRCSYLKQITVNGDLPLEQEVAIYVVKNLNVMDVEQLGLECCFADDLRLLRV